MKLLSLRAGLLVWVILASSSVIATTIGYNFEGTIDRHTGDPWSEVGFGIGDRFTGQYTFESTTLGFDARPMFNISATAYTLESFTVTSQGNTITSVGEKQNGIVIDDGFSRNIDAYFVVLSSVSSYNELYIDLRSTNSSLFTSEDLPLVLPHLSNFDNSSIFRVRTLGSNGDFSWAQGDIDSLQIVSNVPVPPALILMLSGLLGTYSLTRKKVD